jgi:hypothetical protein
LHSLEVLCGQTPESLRQQLQSRAAKTGDMLSAANIPQADDNLALSLPAETCANAPISARLNIRSMPRWRGCGRPTSRIIPALI